MDNRDSKFCKGSDSVQFHMHGQNGKSWTYRVRTTNYMTRNPKNLINYDEDIKR